MVVIEFELEVRAPIERVFDLSRSVEMHIQSTARTAERAVAGVTSGLMTLDDEVEWEARHFGLRQRLRSRITEFDRPRFFRDSMVHGAFRHFDHDHHFRTSAGSTVARERFEFSAPLGPLGWLAERMVLERYMHRFLRARSLAIKQAAESDAWRRYLEA
jgi:ligand-binding SRPBCC domain-containing protein